MLEEIIDIGDRFEFTTLPIRAKLLPWFNLGMCVPAAHRWKGVFSTFRRDTSSLRGRALAPIHFRTHGGHSAICHFWSGGNPQALVKNFTVDCFSSVKDEKFEYTFKISIQIFFAFYGTSADFSTTLVLDTSFKNGMQIWFVPGFEAVPQAPTAQSADRSWICSILRWSIFVGGGNSNIFLIFIPNLGEDSYFDSYFSKGLVQPPTSFVGAQAFSGNTFSLVYERLETEEQQPFFC